jgi:hypothetical protein
VSKLHNLFLKYQYACDIRLNGWLLFWLHVAKFDEQCQQGLLAMLAALPFTTSRVYYMLGQPVARDGRDQNCYTVSRYQACFM